MFPGSIFLLIVIISLLCVRILKRVEARRRAAGGAELFITLEKAAVIVTELEQCGYYAYTSTEDMAALKKDLQQSIARAGALTTRYNDSFTQSLDARYYPFSAAALFKKDGYLALIMHMQPLFAKMGLACDPALLEEHYDLDDGQLNYSFTFNGKAYTIFDQLERYAWGDYGASLAVLHFADMINDQLALQGKKERLYLMGADRECKAVFLTDTQFDLLNRVIEDKDAKPYTVAKWGVLFGAKAG